MIEPQVGMGGSPEQQTLAERDGPAVRARQAAGGWV
jgi:hypothetical protein